MRSVDRLSEQDYQIPSLQLMQNAAQACFLEIQKYFSGNRGKKALILCGPGNNGGDGAALGQLLHGAGVESHVYLFGRIGELKGDARTNFDILRQTVSSRNAHESRSLSITECESVAEWQVRAEELKGYDLIIDALFGTGLRRPLEGVFEHVVDALARLRSAVRTSASSPLILSIDIPSGLNADLAKPIGPTVQADLTVTFTAPKPANVLPPASHFGGKLVVAQIGSPTSLVDSLQSRIFVVDTEDVHNWLTRTRYTHNSYKNIHGHVLVVAGSRGYTGAAALCGDAAMRSGAGLVTVATPASAQELVAAAAMPEVMTVPLAETDRGAVSDEAIAHVLRLSAKASVVCIGPGLSAEDERTRKFVYEFVKQRSTPVVIDADGLNSLSPWPEELRGSKREPLILTPHQGEMLRLLGTDDKAALDDRVEIAREFATKHDLILVLKGSRTLIATSQGVFINPTGNPGLGTAGSGDTLTGVIAGFIAQAVETLKENRAALDATIAAVYVSGLAGDLAANQHGMRTMVASDIRDHLGEAICLLDPVGEYP